MPPIGGALGEHGSMLYLGLIGLSGLGWTAWRLAGWIHSVSW